MVRSNKLTVCPCTCSCVGLLYSIDHICELAGETDEMRMWRTDHRGKPLFLFQEPKKTLREERVSNNSIVLLEKGKLPAAGEISMALTVYRTIRTSWWTWIGRRTRPPILRTSAFARATSPRSCHRCRFSRTIHCCI